jgi:hypothetical protein
VTRGAVFVLLALLPACWGTNVDLGGGTTTLDAAREDHASSADSDGGSLLCLYYAPPSVSAPCKSCKAGSKGCQANGCYKGWYCDVGYKQCDPPWYCDAGTKHDASE